MLYGLRFGIILVYTITFAEFKSTLIPKCHIETLLVGTYSFVEGAPTGNDRIQNSDQKLIPFVKYYYFHVNIFILNENFSYRVENLIFLSKLKHEKHWSASITQNPMLIK